MTTLTAVELVAKERGTAWAVQADASDPAAIERMFDDAPRRACGLDMVAAPFRRVDA